MEYVEFSLIIQREEIIQDPLGYAHNKRWLRAIDRIEK